MNEDRSKPPDGSPEPLAISVGLSGVVSMTAEQLRGVIAAANLKLAATTPAEDKWKACPHTSQGRRLDGNWECSLCGMRTPPGGFAGTMTIYSSPPQTEVDRLRAELKRVTAGRERTLDDLVSVTGALRCLLESPGCVAYREDAEARLKHVADRGREWVSNWERAKKYAEAKHAALVKAAQGFIGDRGGRVGPYANEKWEALRQALADLETS